MGADKIKLIEECERFYNSEYYSNGYPNLDFNLFITNNIFDGLFLDGFDDFWINRTFQEFKASVFSNIHHASFILPGLKILTLSTNNDTIDDNSLLMSLVYEIQKYNDYLNNNPKCKEPSLYYNIWSAYRAFCTECRCLCYINKVHDMEKEEAIDFLSMNLSQLGLETIKFLSLRDHNEDDYSQIKVLQYIVRYIAFSHTFSSLCINLDIYYEPLIPESGISSLTPMFLGNMNGVESLASELKTKKHCHYNANVTKALNEAMKTLFPNDYDF